MQEPREYTMFYRIRGQPQQIGRFLVDLREQQGRFSSIFALPLQYDECNACKQIRCCIRGHAIAS